MFVQIATLKFLSFAKIVTLFDRLLVVHGGSRVNDTTLAGDFFHPKVPLPSHCFAGSRSCGFVLDVAHVGAFCSFEQLRVL